jgi:hypothetical protein
MIAQLLQQHFALPYPGHDLLPDSDLELLDADVVGLATSYLNEGGLNEHELPMLRRCLVETEAIVPRLHGEARAYFEGVRAIAAAVLQDVDRAHAV